MELWQQRLLDAHGYLVGKTLASLGLSGDPEVEDLEQEARLALLKAAHEFDPDAGHKFSSFAIPRVRGAILEYRRSRCSWVRRTGQKARARVDVAIVALELRGEAPTPETIRALLEDPRDYDRAAALPVAFPLYWQGEGGGDDWTMRFSLENLAAGGPEVLEVVWEREGEALIERAIKRLTALDRACFRGCIERGMGVREVAARLEIPPGEVTRRRNNSLTLLRQFLKRVSTRLASQTSDLSSGEKVLRKMGRPAGRRFTVKVEYYADQVTRDIALRLAAFEGKSEAAIHRQAIRDKYRRLRKKYPDDPRLAL